jgi:hypothetical protein
VTLQGLSLVDVRVAPQERVLREGNKDERIAHTSDLPDFVPVLVYPNDTGIGHDHFAKQHSPLPIGNPRCFVSFSFSSHLNEKPHESLHIGLATRLAAVEQNVVNIVLKCRVASQFKV